MARTLPNILIVGTPGTGKTTLSQAVCEKTSLTLLNVGEIVKEHNFYETFDSERQCHVLDEEKLLDYLEDELAVMKGGFVVDYHGCDFFPERWFDAVFVLRTNNSALFDRLSGRGYPATKVRENVECEIFGVLSEEAREAYPAVRIFRELQSNTPDDALENAEIIADWAKNF